MWRGDDFDDVVVPQLVVVGATDNDGKLWLDYNGKKFMGVLYLLEEMSE